MVNTTSSMARSPLVVALLLSLFLLSSLASSAVGWSRRGEEEEGDDERRRGRHGEGGRPYHFGEESFRHWTRTRHGRFSVLERFSDEPLVGAVGDYRVAVLEAAPRAFLQPSHYDADEVFYVKEGEGVIVLLREGRRESFCVREGDAMVIPAGAIVYSANTHSSKWFRVVMLLNPVSTPGRFEEYFPVGGDRPESFFSAFSDDVLQAAFNTRREELEKVFERQREGGEITTAPEEQVRELSKSCSRGGGSGSEWEIKPSSLTGKRPTYSNNHGKMFEIDGDECRHLRKLDMLVGLANITRGSMMAPSYSTRATKVAMVLHGSGYFEMACPHVSGGRSSERREREREQGRREEWGREEEEQEEEQHGGRQQKARRYHKVRAQVREGSVIVIPAAHPATFVAGDDENLSVLCFGVGANYDDKVFLAGRNSLLRQLDDPAKALVFGGSAAREMVDRVLAAQPEQIFLRGPHGRGGVSDA
ncbi:cupincin-like [Oryza brachyantha]|uniref:cupincin-like n=1 Tax=Oryza brachyantha TaxID=4533 RepID=UPI001ADB42F6|nr:cupincin-like [Oryza brachyantha]